MDNTKYGKRREGRWTPIGTKAQDTRANPNSWETHLVRKRWDIGLLRALSLRIMMMIINRHCNSIGTLLAKLNEARVRQDSSQHIMPNNPWPPLEVAYRSVFLST